MNPDRLSRIHDLCYEALNRHGGDRKAFLEAACAGEPDLRCEIESLLKYEETADGWLERPAWEAASVNRAGPTLKPGTGVGPYRIEDLLGTGGMGQVYRAHDTRLNRPVALKFLFQQFFAGDSEVERFTREAQAIAALNHPNACAVYDIGEHSGRPYLVLELLEGQTLEERLESGRLSVPELLSIGIAVSAALHALHSRGLVHRDIKPGNIFLTSRGEPKILDFGLARTLPVYGPSEKYASAAPAGHVGPSGKLSLPGIAPGTAAYMSPEQARGGTVDSRADLFSLGVVLYEAATGVLPFSGGTNGAILDAIRTKAPRPVVELNRELSPALEHIIEQALEKDPVRRYQTASEIHADLLRTNDRLQTRRRVWTFFAATLLILLFVGIAAGVAWLYWPKSIALSAADYVQITNFTDSAVEPALSSDGKMVAFIRGEQPFLLSTGQIYVKALPNGESIALTDSPRPKYGPVFASDGVRVAYTEVNIAERPAWETWTVSPGGRPTRLLSNAAGLSWLDDQRILFSEIKGTGLHMGVVTATETRSNRQEIYFPAHERWMAHYSYASPDRQWALIVEMDGSGDWQPCRLVPFDGRSEGRQVGPPGECSSAAWSPNGRWMYFSAEVSGASHLWRQGFPAGTVEQMTFGPTEEQGVAMAPDGGSLITSVGMRQTEVWYRDTEGARPISSEGLASSPWLSNDAKRLYYLVREDSRSSAFDLRSLDLTSGKVDRRLPGFSVGDYAISSDETEVAFSIRQPPRKSEVWLAGLDGGSPLRLIARDGDRVSFGSNGRLVFRRLGDEVDYLYSVKRDGSERRRISDLPVMYYFGASRDGQWALVFAVTGTSTSPETVAVPVDGGEYVRVCPFYCAGRWSADGRYFYVEPGPNADRTIVLPVPPGRELPELPPEGINVAADNLPAASVIEHADVFPGPDPFTYAYQVSKLHNNLFRIPVR